ncbi:LRR domain containing protein [Trema orientale]|uniref:LRR domain containing protein n=1 Tax=Trema orientale TaxID=63057 RepID=A0A2P5FGK7_TREOI|nr:LRR domain containing protein [Trema orientale]
MEKFSCAADNHVQGPLPNLTKFSSLEGMFLQHNNLNGALPESQLSKLRSLLSGELPTCWTQFKELFVLNLANNNFSGKIPISLGCLPQIAILHLRNNTFSGELPSFENRKELVLLDLGENQISGKVPEWLEQSLPSLTVLRLRSNKFHGTIPSSLCSLPALQILDLSLNNLSGTIPHCLSNMTAMSSEGRARGFIDFASVMWKGIELEFGRYLELMRSIDISSNYLSGEIPESITSLLELNSLNLSRNTLRGSIPGNFGQLSMLESLDLSRNHLTGSIPTSFSSLTFLGHLDLSYNNLTGRIPLSTQLRGFDASAYIGNPQLCGPPLTKDCPGDETVQDPGVPDESANKETKKDEDKVITLGFYVSMGIGFVMGFWGVCGTLLLNSRWRYAYFRCWDNMNDWIYVTTRVFKARLHREFAMAN